MAGYRNITYDDTRFDVLKYAGSWTNNGSYNAISVGETGTLSSTKDPTGNVTFTFPVPANAFYYYGIPRCCGGRYKICFDCDDLDSFNLEFVDALNRTSDGKNPPVVLHSKFFDKPGVHKVTLTNHHDERFGGNSELTLDRFVLQVENSNLALTSEASSSISATLSIAPRPSWSTITSSSASKPPRDAIVGGVLGGIVAISVCLILWVFIRRRHHTQRMNTHTPTAYTVTHATSDYTSRKTNRASVVAEPSVPNPSSGRAYPSSLHMPVASSEHLPRRETDAGRIDVDDGDDLGTLPPQYEDVFSGGRLNSEQSVTRGLSRRLPRPEPQRSLPLEGLPSGASGQPSSQPNKF